MPARILPLFLALLLAGCIAGGGTETETGTAQITGEVKWPGGYSVAGARVSLRPSDYLGGLGPDTLARDTVTDSAGRFAFHRVRPGEYLVEAIHGEYLGAVTRFALDSETRRIALDPMRLRHLVTVTGRVQFSDSSLGPSAVYVLGTEHVTAADSSTGLFALPGIPQGVYDLRVTTPVPFFPAKDFPGQAVELPGPVRLGNMILDRASKQDFSLAGGMLALAGIDGDNPVLYDNDLCTNTWDNEFLWALASLGRVDLRGNIVTPIQLDSPVVTPEVLSGWSREAHICRLSGMRNIPDPILGATRRLAGSPSGRWQDIVPESNPGIQLLVAEARKASIEKPLVVVVGGPLTTVANALLLDPYIAGKMIVFGVYNHDMNGKDSLASYLVARKCRFVEWGRDYFWAGPGPSAASLSGNWLGLRLKDSRDSAPFPPLFFADFAALSFLVKGRSWTTARGALALSPPLNASLQASAPFDFIDIPREANDWALMDRVFFSILADSAAYHPWPVPGPVGGVSFTAMSGVAMDSIPGEGDIVVDIGPSDWMEYFLEVATEGNYDLIVRNRCAIPTVVRVEGQEAASRADLDLPAGSGWVEARARLFLRMGVQRVRLSTTNGGWLLSQLRLEKVP